MSYVTVIFISRPFVSLLPLFLGSHKGLRNVPHLGRGVGGAVDQLWLTLGLPFALSSASILPSSPAVSYMGGYPMKDSGSFLLLT